MREVKRKKIGYRVGRLGDQNSNAFKHFRSATLKGLMNMFVCRWDLILKLRCTNVDLAWITSNGYT